MFSLPQPSSTTAASSSPESDEELIEGCPILCLHDDPNDLANFLTALYDGPLFGDNGREDFRVVSGLLRLSTKYIVDSLRQRALTHLSEAWPSSLNDWDLREDYARVYELETGASRSFRYPSPIAVINLAREIAAPSLLPAAFYDLSRYSYSQILEAGDKSPLFHTPVHQPREFISPSDMQKLALGKESASQAIPTLIQSITSPGHPHPHHPTANTHRRNFSSSGRSRVEIVCTTASACRQEFLELAQLATQHYIFDREKGSTDPLYVAEELGQLKSSETIEGEDCVACARSLEAWAAKERQKIWEMIPSWFRLDQ
ncbi:hypothetical protein QCA50_013593 [Cerrena zonata]|uniref:BTB/POZ domain-containing protein n=1 Tax=Cerrena zonata TaxID=2478898 RepID=A0AAW0FRC3_9APHY